MNTPRDRDLDRLLEEDAGDIGQLYRRLTRLEPPRRLDRAVLGEAARAVRGRPPRRHRWLVGLGSAAGLVLAGGVAWHVGQDALQQQLHDSARRGMIVVPVEPITEAARKRAPPNDAQPAPAAVPLPAPAHGAAKPGVQPGTTPQPAPRQATAPATSAEPAPPAAAPVAQPMPFPAETRTHVETSAGAAAGQADQDAAAKSERATGRLDQVGPGHTPSFTTPAPSSSIELRRDARLAPDDWLAHIEHLLQQGRRQQAIESLRLFQRMHPERPLPPALRAIEE